MIKEIDIAGALKRIAEGSEQVCMLVPINADTVFTIEELIAAKGFAVVTAQGTAKKEDPDPQPSESKQKKAKAPKGQADIGKIMALYKAGWNISSICLEVGMSYPTVKKYIDQETANAGSEQADS